ncbi:RidA family protein [Desulfosarcina alkanivorans]|jgi:2-iminobutanoate/2-iminopropanoate deaminase|uniref:RidA family protein n=1 Tax=Desulfosarcina alkanivorans TaxID=571177 RepID=A0A5K7YFR3_9BACT|nr:RidA family protein [Desulfosarcina alkanivorans]BBO67898.1 RidA family protein [Desulfosarcina alkanivorans]
MRSSNLATVSTDQAPGAIGPYSQAVKTDTLVFVSGQLAIVPATGELITSTIRDETRQALMNLKAILIEAGSSLENVIKTTLFIADMDDFPQINEVYGKFFPADAPARACVEVSCLPKNARFEVEAVALLQP